LAGCCRSARSVMFRHAISPRSAHGGRVRARRPVRRRVRKRTADECGRQPLVLMLRHGRDRDGVAPGSAGPNCLDTE
jgi:hypothetical protein